METTKTGKLQRIVMPKDIVDILKWHVDQLPKGAMRESELLFPSETGGYRAASCLDRPFDEVATKLKLKKKVTPRAMRRTFQDLARAAEVRGIVTRSISGHSTEAMQRHDSTASGKEQKAGLAKVVELARFRQAARLDPSGRSVGTRRQKQKRRLERDLQTAVFPSRTSWGVQDSDL